MLIETIRNWQIQQMSLSIRTVESIIQNTTTEALTTYRDSGDGWTVLQVLGHLRDFEALFYQRARLTVEHENPPLPFPDPDELARVNNYQGQMLEDVFATWKDSRDMYIEYLKARDEADWERPSQHPTRGAFTLHDQLFLTSLHDTLHIEQITRILAEKKA